MKIISNYLEASKSGQKDREREPEEKKFKEGKQSAPHQRHCGTGWYRASETIGNPTGALWSRKTNNARTGSQVANNGGAHKARFHLFVIRQYF